MILFLSWVRVLRAAGALASFFFFFFKYNFISFFIFGCAGSSLLRRLLPSCSQRGLLLVAVPGPLVAAASHVAERGLQ